MQLKTKERTLNEVSKKLAAAQSLILTLENKVVDLEQSLALSKRADLIESDSRDSVIHPHTNCNMEIQALEHRLKLLESQFSEMSRSDRNIVVNNNNNYGNDSYQP